MGDGFLEVRGGPGGIAVELEDLAAAAATLQDGAAWLAEQVRSLSARTAAVGASAALRAARDPGSVREVASVVARLEAACGSATDAGLSEAADLASLAVVVRACARLYAEGEEAVEGVVQEGADAVMTGVARALPVLTVIGAVGVGVAGVDDTLARVDRTLADHPWLVTLASEGADGMVQGVRDLGPGVERAVATACAAQGRPWPPTNDTEAVGVIVAVAGMLGGLDEAGRSVAVSEVTSAQTRSRPVTVPTGLGGLVRGSAELERLRATVRVLEVPQPGGAPPVWVVEVPGTQDWGPRAGTNPFDVTSDVGLMAGELTLATSGVREALARARAGGPPSRRAGPVMLSGHSQGGIIAAALASDPGFVRTHHVRSVVVSGAPIDRFPLVGGVDVLAIEHTQDIVPRLDGARTPDSRSWTTVRRTLPAATGSARASTSHDSRLYVGTADLVDAIPEGRERSVDEWRRTAEPFLRGEGVVVREYVVSRSP